MPWVPKGGEGASTSLELVLAPLPLDLHQIEFCVQPAPTNKAKITHLHY